MKPKYWLLETKTTKHNSNPQIDAFTSPKALKIKKKLCTSAIVDRQSTSWLANNGESNWREIWSTIRHWLAMERQRLAWSEIILPCWSAIRLIGVWLAVEKPDLSSSHFLETWCILFLATICVWIGLNSYPVQTGTCPVQLKQWSICMLIS